MQSLTDKGRVMLIKKLNVLFLLGIYSGGSEATQCDLFHNGLLCALDPVSNIVGAVFDLPSELGCQAECASDANCNQFMFLTFLDNNRPSDCFLLKECTTNTTSCKDTPDCAFSVTGPKSPPIIEACCQDFQDVTCEKESEIDHFYDVTEASECQSLCRDTSGCLYWSLYEEICFLYNNSNTPHPCSSFCSSGPVFPDILECETDEMYETLLIGGKTSVEEDVTSSLVLITQNKSCTPQIDQTIIAKEIASAAVLGSKIFYCGGRPNDGQD